MFTDEQIEQLAKVIDTRLKSNNVEIRKDIQAAKTEVIEVIQKAEDEIIETLKMTTGALAQKQDEHEARIKQLEDPEVLPRSH